MKDFFEIDEKQIILQGTTNPPYGEHKYIAYLNKEDNYIHVNTYYYKVSDNIYKCCTHYDRKLCDDVKIIRTIEELRETAMKYIETQAYGSWMDGAR